MSEVKTSPTQAAQATQQVERLYTSCCFKVNPGLLTFFIHAFISIAIIFLSAYLLLQRDRNSDERVFWAGLLTSTISVWVPSPVMHARGHLPDFNINASSLINETAASLPPPNE